MSFSDFLKENTQKGTYAAVKFSDLTNHYLMNLIKELDIENPVTVDDLHCTLLYSTKYLPNYKPIGEIREIASPKGFEIFEGDTNYLVLLLNCEFLTKRHKYLMKKHEAKYSHDEYKPHITLSTDYSGDLPTLIPSEFIVLNNEYSEDLDD